MRRVCLAVLVVGLVLGAVPWAAAQDQKPEPTAPKVTLDVTDQPAADVAADITKQSSVQVGVVSPCTALATVKVTDVKTEPAVKAFGEAIEASWIRAYVLESAPPATPWTADQLYAGMNNQRENWFDSFTDEERGKLFEQWRASGAFGRGRGGPGQGPGQGQGPGAQGGPPPAAGEGQAAPQAQAAPQPPPEMPGAGRSNMQRRLREEAQKAAQAAQAAGGQAPEGQPAAGQPAAGQPAAGQPAAGQPGQGGPGGQGGRFGVRLYDPVGDLIIPVRTDTVTLTLQDTPLQEALYDFTTASGFIVAAGADLTGNITLQAENKPIEEVLAQIATAVNAKWRPIYLLSVPRQLSEAEQEAQMEQRFQSRWARFWAKSPEERAADIQQQVDRINRMAERMRQGAQQGRGGGRFQRFGARMAQRMARYSAGLSDAQRKEIKPLLQAMSKAFGGQ